MFLCAKAVGGSQGFHIIRQATQVSIVSFNIVSRFGSDDFLFLTGEFCPQLVGDRFGYFGFYAKDIL